MFWIIDDDYVYYANKALNIKIIKKTHIEIWDAEKYWKNFSETQNPEQYQRRMCDVYCACYFSYGECGMFGCVSTIESFIEKVFFASFSTEVKVLSCLVV